MNIQSSAMLTTAIPVAAAPVAIQSRAIAETTLVAKAAMQNTSVRESNRKLFSVDYIVHHMVYNTNACQETKVFRVTLEICFLIKKYGFSSNGRQYFTDLKNAYDRLPIDIQWDIFRRFNYQDEDYFKLSEDDFTDQLIQIVKPLTILESTSDSIVHPMVYNPNACQKTRAFRIALEICFLVKEAGFSPDIGQHYDILYKHAVELPDEIRSEMVKHLQYEENSKLCKELASQFIRIVKPPTKGEVTSVAQAAIQNTARPAGVPFVLVNNKLYEEIREQVFSSNREEVVAFRKAFEDCVEADKLRSPDVEMLIGNIRRAYARLPAALINMLKTAFASLCHHPFSVNSKGLLWDLKWILQKGHAPYMVMDQSYRDAFETMWRVRDNPKSTIPDDRLNLRFGSSPFTVPYTSSFKGIRKALNSNVDENSPEVRQFDLIMQTCLKFEESGLNPNHGVLGERLKACVLNLPAAMRKEIFLKFDLGPLPIKRFAFHNLTNLFEQLKLILMQLFEGIISITAPLSTTSGGSAGAPASAGESHTKLFDADSIVHDVVYNSAEACWPETRDFRIALEACFLAKQAGLDPNTGELRRHLESRYNILSFEVIHLFWKRFNCGNARCPTECKDFADQLFRIVKPNVGEYRGCCDHLATNRFLTEG